MRSQEETIQGESVGVRTSTSAQPDAASAIGASVDTAGAWDGDAVFRELIDAAPVLLWVADASGGRVFLNRGWLDFTGRTPEQELGDGWLRGVHPDDRELVLAAYRKAAQTKTRCEIEYRLRSHNGQYRWMLSMSLPRDSSGGEFAGTIGTCVDITEHRQSRNELEQLLAASDEAHANLAEQTRQLLRLADTDPLTGLLNRRSFREQFEREWLRSLRHGRPLACVMLDIDFFKRVNDLHGHLAGDATLRKIAELLARQCRPSDVIGRYGGEEFCIMAPETTEQGAASLAERIRFVLAETPVEIGERTLHVTGSFGAADCMGELNNVDELVARADQALQIAKHSGRNRVARYSSEESLVEWIAQHSPTRLLCDATARELLTPTPSIEADATIAEAVEILLQSRVGLAPVVDKQGKLAGCVSERDLMVLNVSPEAWSGRVADVMKSNVVCYEEGAPGNQVFQFLCRALVHRVVIAEGGRPIGIISPTSLLAFFRDRVAEAASCCGSTG
jgi:diguanylate cyclase (GGDEF)-like protein/PAS domain S-box-containing protein